MNNVDEIKSKLDIVEVISDYIKLTPAGVNFKALCPFHREKTPSFFISPERQIWHCFGCGKGGDIFGFVKEIEGIEFPEALKILAKKAGVILEKKDYHLISQKTKILDILNLSAKFYHLILLKSPLAEAARNYLKARQLNQEIIKTWQLGFAPDRWQELYKFLIKKGFKEQDIELAGLIIQGKNSCYDRFRNRIIFPICNIQAEVVGFTSRILPSSKESEVAKYINTPETPVYSKSRILYGLDRARLEIKKENSVILVEGNMDVLTCHQNGIKNVVASSGTSLTLEQLKILKRYTDNLLLSFDFDIGGETATKRGIDLALKEDFNVKVIILEKGKDPDECIKKDITLFKEAIKKAMPIMDYYFSRTFADKSLESIDEKKQIIKILIPLIKKLFGPAERDLYLKKLAKKLEVSESSLYEELSRVKTVEREIGDEKKEVIEEKSKKIEERFLGLLLLKIDRLKEYLGKISPEMFQSFQIQELVRLIKKKFDAEEDFSLKEIKGALKGKNLDFLPDLLIFSAEKDFKDDKEILKEIKILFSRIKKRWTKNRIEELTKLLKLAEENSEKERIKEISKEINKLCQIS